MSYHRSRETRRRLRKLSRNSPGYSPSGAWYNEEKGRYIRFYARGSHGSTKWLRTVANHKVRRAKNVPQGGGYRRVYDYWWELD